MRILQLCADLGVPVLGSKGAAVHVRAMALALRAEGHAVLLAAGQLVKSPWQPPAALEVPVVHLPPGPEVVHASARLRAFAAGIGAPASAAGEVRRLLHDREVLAQLRQRFEHDPPDLIYERASLFGTAGLTFAREIGRPHLLELNAPLADEQRRYRSGGALHALAESSEAWLLSGTDAVLAVSAALADHAIARGASPARVHVVANGVDIERFRPGHDDGVRARFGLGAGPVLGFVGGLRPWHGIESLPAVVAALRARHPDIRALVVGDGPLRPTVEREVERLGLQAHVTLAGGVAHDEVPSFIRAFDLALAPYPVAPHAFYFSPLKLYEYLACGVPVVAARLGQIADVVTDGETGRLYPAGDLGALVSACDDLLADRDGRREMGRRAAAQTAARHSWRHNARRVAAIAHAVAGVEAVPA